MPQLLVSIVGWAILVLGLLSMIMLPLLALFVCYIAWKDSKENAWLYRSHKILCMRDEKYEAYDAAENWRQTLRNFWFPQSSTSVTRR